MQTFFLPVIILFSGLFFFCSPQKRETTISSTVGSSFFYNLNEPSKKQFLGYELEEISGLSWVKNGVLAAVQDEDGILFLYDFEKGEVKERLKFGKSGDYEGVEVIGKQAYVVNSSGNIFTFPLRKPDQAEKVKTPLSSKNDVEGLAYDSDKDFMLIACKANAGHSSKSYKGRAIYKLDIRLEMEDEPYIRIKKSDLEKLAGEDIRPFKPSGIAYHPIEKRYYLISGPGYALAVLDKESLKPVEYFALSPKDFKQIEGICFSPDGQLYISSEGNGGDGYILSFEYKK